MLVVFMKCGAEMGELVYLSRQREPLDRLIEARRFRCYHLREVVPRDLPVIEKGPRGLSICWLRDDALRGDTLLLKLLIEAGCLTLGHLVDLGEHGLFELGISGKLIRRIRNQLLELGLELAPIEEPAAVA
jgi:hypothetical protein